MKLSVIVPIYNAQEYLDKCLSCIVNQSYVDMEILLIDDGSTDESGKICDKFAKKDARIRVIHKLNEGLVKTRKCGIALASGEYITFVDADDWIDKDTYSNLFEKASNADIIAYGMIEEYENRSVTKKNNIPIGIYDKKQIQEQIVPYILYSGIFYEFGLLPNLVCKIIKKELLIKCIEKVSGDVTIGEDVDFSCNVFFEADSICVLDDTPYHYVQRDNSMMRSKTPINALIELYKDLRNVNIKNYRVCEWNRQLETYMEFVILLKAPWFLFDKLRLFRLIKQKRILIYGAGNFGRELKRSMAEKDYTNVVAMADKNWEKVKGYEIPVVGIDGIKDFEFDYIIIAILNKNICESVRDTLIQNGVENSKILFFKASDDEMQDMNILLEGI